MYAADSQAGKIYALDLGAQANGGAPGTANVDNLTQKIAAMLGTDAAQVAVTDLAVDARTRNSFVSVMRGQGPAARPALLRVDGAGAISVINTDALQFTSVDLPNLPAPNAGGRTPRSQSITQVRFANGRVWASGLSNEEFASKLWSIAYPFTRRGRRHERRDLSRQPSAARDARADVRVRARTRLTTSSTSSAATCARRW